MAVNSNGKKSRKIPLRFEWVLPLFIKPRKTISTIVEQDKPAWLTPLLILSALLLITVLVSGPIRLQQIQSGATLPQDFQYYSEADQQKFLTAQATQSSPLFVYVFPFLSGMLKLWISWFLLGSLLYLSLTLAGSKAYGGFELASAADKVTVTIKDSNGLEVRKLELGDAEAGLTFSGAQAVDGKYTMSVSATRGDTDLKPTALQLSTVNSVLRTSSGTVSLDVGGSLVSLADIKQIL